MKKKIALVTGGYSGEAVISYRSAATIFHHLDKEKFDVFKIDVTTVGWFYEDENGAKTPVDKNDFTINRGGEKISFDAILIGMHGTPGEDGRLQGYFDMLQLPYTSCSAAVSALTFNKRYTTAVAGMSGINVARSVLLMRESYSDAGEIVASLSFPVFVKPNNGGSSIGMSRVDSADDGIEEAIAKAFREDSQVLVEEIITGREFTIGVYKDGNGIHVLPITEVVAHNKFFDFEAKYQGKSSETTPAAISEEWRQSLENTARKVYQVFNCQGVVRIDFIFNEEKGEPFMLEINTIPGQSDASVIPQQVRAEGNNLTAFYTVLVEQALAQAVTKPTAATV